MARKKTSTGFVEIIMSLRKAGLESNKHKPPPPNMGNLSERAERFTEILKWLKRCKLKPSESMLYFIMYDIEDNKVRRHIAKYLIKQGCQRVQKSIFVSNSSRKLFDEISQTLSKVNEMYENGDSIFILPVTTDQVGAMRVIGHETDFKLVAEYPSTYFI